jgi:hypothetical protein
VVEVAPDDGGPTHRAWTYVAMRPAPASARIADGCWRTHRRASAPR